jgi:hypothetical protein
MRGISKGSPSRARTIAVTTRVSSAATGVVSPLACAATSLAAQSEVNADGSLLTEPPRHQMVLSGRAERSQAYERDD